MQEEIEKCLDLVRRALLQDDVSPYGGLILDNDEEKRLYFSQEDEPNKDWLADALSKIYPLFEFGHEYLLGCLTARHTITGKQYNFSPLLGVSGYYTELERLK